MSVNLLKYFEYDKLKISYCNLAYFFTIISHVIEYFHRKLFQVASEVNIFNKLIN